MIALAVVIGLIVYGTLYPWSFQPNPFASAQLLLRTFPLTPRLLVDAVANVVVYIPLGLTLFLQLRRMLGPVASALLTVVLGGALSFGLEYAQFFQPTRFPNGLDVFTNTIGSAVGAIAVWILGSRSLRLRKPSAVEILFWTLWIGALTFPLIPVLSPYTIRMKLSHVLAFDTGTMLSFALQWLIGGVLLAKGKPQWIGATFLLIPAQLFISGRQPTQGMLMGALAGAALALSPAKLGAKAAAGVALLVLWELAPFRTRPAVSFEWMAFADAMSASRAGAVSVVMTKAFAYGGCIALLVRAGAPLVRSGFGVALLLFLAEIAQIWIVGRTPSLTDPAVALLATAVLARFREGVSATPTGTKMKRI